ncbi:hypothetical protein MNV49_001989 [Pseudohyphozyma bogoriensis]|nr:hypothetical protein MNV49_001989 [Pseudohyphozyma bogoriensis]
MATPASAERADELKDNYAQIVSEVDAASADRPEGQKPRLVAVSKLKPSSDILSLFNTSNVRHFGENYPQELYEKSQELPTEIQWHFIGALQSNKCKMLASIPNLFAIETLSTIKSADLLQKALAAQSPARDTPLNVYLQINTSGEDSKSGLPPLSSSSSDGESELVLLASHILSSCPLLRLKGLMTIGSFTASTSTDPNPDFETLGATRDALVKALESKDGESDAFKQVKADGLELSCGMSEDFAQAIKQGSSNVRVGSRIFGARPPRKA